MVHKAANVKDQTDERARLTLVALSEFVNIEDPELIFAQLAERGCVLRSPTEPWRPLSGGLEYNHYVSDPISVDEIISTVLAEITRTSVRHDESWVDNFQLRPSRPSQLDWVENIRDVLARDFELEPSTDTRLEIYARGGARCLLVCGSSTEPPHLLLHQRVETTAEDF